MVNDSYCISCCRCLKMSGMLRCSAAFNIRISFGNKNDIGSVAQFLLVGSNFVDWRCVALYIPVTPNGDLPADQQGIENVGILLLLAPSLGGVTGVKVCCAVGMITAIFMQLSSIAIALVSEDSWGSLWRRILLAIPRSWDWQIYWLSRVGDNVRPGLWSHVQCCMCCGTVGQVLLWSSWCSIVD